MNNKIIYFIIGMTFVGGFFSAAYAGPIVSKITLSGNVLITGDTEIDGKLLDSNNEAGNSNQILSSTGVGIDWIDGGVAAGPYSIYAGEFEPGDTAVTATGNNGNNYRVISLCQSANCILSAPIHIPQSSTVTNLSCNVYDNDGTQDVSIALVKHDGDDTVSTTGCSASTTGASSSIQQISVSCTEVINNSNNAYAVRFSITGECSTDGDDCRIYTCKIDY